MSFQEVVGCDDDLGRGVSVGKVELKQDWIGLDWVGWTGLDRTDWFVKGGRRSQAGWGRAGQGRWMERRSNKHFFVLQQKADRLKGRELCGCNAMSRGLRQDPSWVLPHES